MCHSTKTNEEFTVFLFTEKVWTSGHLGDKPKQHIFLLLPLAAYTVQKAMKFIMVTSLLVFDNKNNAAFFSWITVFQEQDLFDLSLETAIT